jgi:hypothetical protein
MIATVLLSSSVYCQTIGAFEGDEEFIQLQALYTSKIQEIEAKVSHSTELLSQFLLSIKILCKTRNIFYRTWVSAQPWCNVELFIRLVAMESLLVASVETFTHKKISMPPSWILAKCENQLENLDHISKGSRHRVSEKMENYSVNARQIQSVKGFKS